MKPTPIPAGTRLRAPQMADLEAVVQMLRDWEKHHQNGASNITLDDMRDDWEKMDLAENALLLTAEDGTPIAYADYLRKNDTLFEGFAMAALGYEGQGIEETLLELFEARAAEAAKAGGLHEFTFAVHAGWNTELEKERYPRLGFRTVMYWIRMGIDMTEAPPTPHWPAGIVLKPFEPETDTRLLFDARHEVFKDQKDGATMAGYEQFVSKVQSQGFRKDLWWLALHDGEVAGFLMCDISFGTGYVSTIGVVPDWRGRRLGKALLLHAFGEFYARGERTVRLTVDAENPNDATGFYEHCGMKQLRQYVRFEKKLTIC